MATFVDDFDRANGALGGNWTTIAGTVSISGNAAVGSNASVSYNSTVSDSGRLEASLHCTSGHTSGYRAGPMVKNAGASNAGFALSVQDNARPYTLQLLSQGSIGGTVLASLELDIVLPVMYKLTLIWDAGHLSGYYNDQLLIEFDSELYYNNTYTGFVVWGSTCPVLDFAAVGGAAVGLTVSPLVIPNYATTVPMTATGTNTAWTSGTPGTPAFTVDHGTISAQTVDSATGAHWTYDPGLYLGGVVFTDPSTGATCAAVVSSNPGTVPVGGIALSETAIAYIERSAVAQTEPTILNVEQPVTAAGASITVDTMLARLHLAVYNTTATEGESAGTNKLLWLIYGMLSGYYPGGPTFDQPQTATSVKNDLETILAQIATMRTANDWTLGSVITEIAGTGVPQISDVIDAIAALETGGSVDLSPVTDLLEAMRGDTTTSLATLLTSLAGIRTLQTYSLGDVKDWIDALPGDPTLPNAAAVVALIAALLLAVPSGGASVAGVAIAAGAGPILDIATLVEVISVLTQLAELAGAVAAIDIPPPSVGPPVWPGAAGADLGEPLALQPSMTITDAMDGVIVEITSTDANTAYYTYGGTKNWRHVGALAFFTDTGHIETYQALGFENAIYTPKQMKRAGGVKLFTGRGATGTITPWLISS